MSEFGEFIKNYHDKRLTNKTEAQITQAIRLIDVLVIAPILLYMGITGNINKGLRIFLIVLAVVSIAYNSYYFFKYGGEICKHNSNE